MHRLFPAAVLAAAALAAQTQAPAKPKSDNEIRSCIDGALKRSPKLSDEAFSVTVANTVATFNGTAKKQGSKGGVYAIASSCGASKVINNIVAEIPKENSGSKKK